MPVSIFSDDFDIYIVGTGIKWVQQISLEADKVFELCNEILYIEKAPGIDKYFRTKCERVTDLTQYYSEDKDRELTYREMASHVVRSAIERKPVALAVYGHPTIYAYPPFLVREMGSQLGLKTRVMPGISALDCLFADLMIDPSVNGIQMYEATDLLLRRHKLIPTTSTIIWQIGSIMTALYSSQTSSPERFTTFRDYLLGFFPEDHLVYSYFANPHPMLKPEIHNFTVGNLPEFAHLLHAAVTLYLPPVIVENKYDPQLVKLLKDPNYLRDVTRRSRY